MSEARYTGLRCKYHGLRFNAWVEMVADVTKAIETSRSKLIAQFPDDAEFVGEASKATPWEIKSIQAGWGFPDRVMVTW